MFVISLTIIEDYISTKVIYAPADSIGVDGNRYNTVAIVLRHASVQQYVMTSNVAYGVTLVRHVNNRIVIVTYLRKIVPYNDNTLGGNGGLWRNG